jgi:transcriptional regulator with XRE-family HTH domain
MNDEQLEQVKRQVRELLEQRGWSQAQLAERAGVSENTVAHLLLGRKRTQGSKIRAILDALGVPEDRQGILALDGVPEDVRVFATVAVRRLSVLDEANRNAVLARLYPLILETIAQTDYGT